MWRQQIGTLASVCLVCLVAPLGCSSEDDGSDRLCRLARQVHEQLGADKTDPTSIRALVRQLPDDLRYAAALYYYPYGGDVRPDADGGQATEAGNRLSAYYKKTCGSWR